jgi:hypothetical protein
VNRQLQAIMCIAALSLSGVIYAAPVTVFSTDFDTTLPAAISPDTAFITGVQGYAGLGPVGNQFGGTFLRSETGNIVTLQLSNMPAHNAINLAFLFAAIDSLDGSGTTYPQGDYFIVVLDGTTIFNESFANAQSTDIQSYAPPVGVELARRVDLGFTVSTFSLDSAYNLGADPIFSNIPHSASTATIQFVIQGVGNQDLNDESWAMDNLSVSVVSPVPVPSAVWLFGSGVLGLIGISRRGNTA